MTTKQTPIAAGLPPNIHSCSYFCNRPECIKGQRDALREKLYGQDAQPQPAIPGWQWVPVEPTDDMLRHADKTVQTVFSIGDEYRAMLASAPQPAAEPSVDLAACEGGGVTQWQPSAELTSAAQAVLDRWNSPKWEWHKHGPTADLMADLARAISAQPNHKLPLPADVLLFEHSDGRYAVATAAASAAFTTGEPAWYRVGPVDVSWLAPASSERVALTLAQIDLAVRNALTAFCLDEYSSFEIALTRKVEAAHGIAPRPDAPTSQMSMSMFASKADYDKASAAEIGKAMPAPGAVEGK